MGTPALAKQFGDISAFPTLFLFDPTGNPVGTWLGAPPTLHDEVERAVAAANRSTGTSKEKMK
jgi:hypothetical protein